MKNILPTLFFFVFFFSFLNTSAQKEYPFKNIARFDGEFSYYSFTLAKGYLNNDFTIDMWAYLVGSGDEYAYFSMDDGQSVVSFRQNCRNNTQEFYTHFYDKNEVHNETRPSSTSNYQGKWIHIALVFHNKGTKTVNIGGTNIFVMHYGVDYYYDGVKHDTKNIYSDHILKDHDLTVNIGGFRTNHYKDYNGMISMFRIWSHPLNSTEINYFKNVAASYDTDATGIEYVRRNLIFAGYGYMDQNQFGRLQPSVGYYGTQGTTQAGSYDKNILRPARPTDIFAVPVCEGVEIHRAGGDHLPAHVYREGRCMEDPVDFLNYYGNGTTFDIIKGGHPGADFTYQMRFAWDYDTRKLTSDWNTPINGSKFRPNPVINPSNLAVDVVCENADLKLSWDHYNAYNYLADNYNIYRSTDKSAWALLEQNYTGIEYIDQDAKNYLGDSLYYRIGLYENIVGTDMCADVFTDADSIKGEIPNIPLPVAAPFMDSVNVKLVDENIQLDWKYDWYTPNDSGKVTQVEIFSSVDETNYFSTGQIVDLKDDSLSMFEYTADMCNTFTYKLKGLNKCTSTDESTVWSLPSVPIKRPTAFSGVLNSEKAYIDASKGYYNNKISIEWKANPEKKTDINLYELYRQDLSNHGEQQLIATFDNNNRTTYEDIQCNANTMYLYKLVAFGQCDTNIFRSDTIETLGFRTTTGIVAGNISFEGGNPVENVEVQIQPDQRILEYSVKNDSAGMYIFTEKTLEAMGVSSMTNFTFESWIKPELKRSNVLTTSNGRVKIDMDRDGIYVQISDGTITDELSIEKEIKDSWQYLGLVINDQTISLYHKDSEFSYSTSTLTIHMDSLTNRDSLYIGHPDNLYYGSVDETRIWNISVDSTEMVKLCNRQISPKNKYLRAYWKFNENWGEYAYDISNTSENYHKNHLKFSESVIWNEEVPTFEQLHPAGETDEYGNYIIESIPYNGTGGIFKVIPKLGIHKFSPTEISLYIGDNSPVHNGIDFIDNSSFKIPIEVTYTGTDIDVEGVEIYLDGELLLDGGGNPVKTTGEGNDSISVPIGHHYVSVKKENHIFTKGGQFPTPTKNEPYKTFNFQSNDFKMTFTDSTFVTVAGRVVGGNQEGNKELGFDRSNANIGSTRIHIFNDYSYDTIIYTDSVSGEYMIDLLPLNYKIDTVQNNHYDLLNGTGESLSLTNVPVVITLYDSIFDNDSLVAIDSAQYHFTKNFIYYSDPQITMGQQGSGTIEGEKLLKIQLPDNSYQKIAVDTILDHPVFLSNKTYAVHAKVEEEYVNYQTGDIVRNPVKNARVTFTNYLSIDESPIEYITNENGIVNHQFIGGTPNFSSDSVSFRKTLSVQVMTPNGINLIWPSEATPFFGYVLGSQQIGGSNFVTLGPEVPSVVLHDPPGSNSYAYIEKGSSLSISSSFNIENNSNKTISGTLSMGTEKEIKFPFIGGVTVEKQKDQTGGLEMSYTRDESGKLVTTYTFRERIQTSSDPKMVGQMADVFVGESKNAVFSECQYLEILPSDFASSNGLNHLDNGKSYTIAIRDGFNMKPDSTRTLFIYSKYHIVESLIPTLIELRDQLFVNKTLNYESYLDASHPQFGCSNDSKLLQQGELSYNYTESNDAPYDEVAFYNQQINIWMQTLALNEATTINSEKTGNISYDAGSGTYLSEKSYEKDYLSSFSTSRSYNMFFEKEKGFWIDKKGIKIKQSKNIATEYTSQEGKEEKSSVKFGYVIDDSDLGDYFSFDVKQASAENPLTMDNFMNEMILSEEVNEDLPMTTLKTALNIFKFKKLKDLKKIPSRIKNFPNSLLAAYCGQLTGYNNYRDQVQEEGSEIDILSGFDLESPSFSVIGGQSRCPHEGEEFSLFYMPNGQDIQMQVGTQAHEGMDLTIFPSARYDVPDIGKANFDLSLTNVSPTGRNLTYQLLVDESSNPDGAIIKIDGLNPNRNFFLEANKTITKTVTVEKGRNDVMDYENLKLILRSLCQPYDFADTIGFSVHFKPTCTPVAMNIQDNWVVNTEDDGILSLKISGYDLNHSKFERIKFQYQQPGSSLYNYKTFFLSDTTEGYNSGDNSHVLIDGCSEIPLDYEMTSVDGIYDVRAITECSDGTETATPFYRGIKDMISPVPFGTPQPSDGVLSYGEDILIRFNEDINTGDLQFNKDKIKLRGILNGTDLQYNPELMHSASVYFDGIENYVSIPSVNLQNSSFALDFWVRRQSTGKACLINQTGRDGGDMWIGFNENDQLAVVIDNETAVSEMSYDLIDEWMHVNVSYHIGSAVNARNITILVESSKNESAVVTEIESQISSSGNMFVGKQLDGQFPFEGDIHELRIWNTNKSMNYLSSNKYKWLNGYEENLYGYWPMNKAFGNVLIDKANGRHGSLFANWNVNNSGKSIDLNGGYAQFSTGQMSFDDQTDFTIEMWFYSGTVASEQCLFSNGSSENTHWSVSLTPDNQIRVTNYEKSFTADLTNSLNAAAWHHIALSVNRRGNTGVYFDGELISSVNSNEFGGFAAAQAIIGSRYSYINQTEVIDQPFNGLMDEFRIWNAALDKTQIQSKMNQSLKGNEPGLKVYFPFEDITITDPLVTNESLLNYSVAQYSKGGDCVLNNALISDEVPNIKLADPIQQIPFDFVTSEDEIYIYPLTSAAQIENRILEISVEDILDLNNNKLQSTVKWTAFVDQNSLVWEHTNLSATIHPGSTFDFSSSIINRSGNNEYYKIENVPQWLTLNIEEGNIHPLETIEVTGRSIEGLNYGQYTGEIHLISSMNYKEKIVIDLNVEPKKPNWSVNPANFENSMLIIGQLEINGIISTDENDMLGIFSNNQCVGVTNVEYYDELNIYLINGVIYGNQQSTEPLELRIWDHSMGKEYVDATPEVTFTPNHVLGRPSDPVLISTSGSESQMIALTHGWNWVSFNLLSDKLNNSNALFEHLTPGEGDLISGKQFFDQYSLTYGWEGLLSENDGMKNTDMYKIHLSDNDTLRYSGTQINPLEVSLTLNSGWNWISYLPGVNMRINEAFSDFTPTQDDIIKGRDAFAIYDPSLGWMGSMKWMEPGKGYMYKSNHANEIGFHYPVISSLKSGSTSTDSELTILNDYGDNMNIIGQIEGMDDLSNSKIVAYAGNQFIGEGNYDVNNDLYFITVNGNQKLGDIQYLFIQNNENYTLTESISFTSNKITGSLQQPFVFSFNDNYFANKDGVEEVTCYPNPFNDQLEISYKGDEEIHTIEIYDFSGSLIIKKTGLKHKIITINGDEIPANGIYYIRIITSGNVIQTEIIKQ